MKAFTISLLACAALAACGPNIAMVKLKSQGAQDLRCGADQVSAEETGAYRGLATGCGRSVSYIWSSHEERWVSALDRATFDLSCPREQFAMTQIGDLQVGVEGCGKKAVYVYNPFNRAWLLNGTTEQPPAAPATTAR